MYSNGRILGVKATVLRESGHQIMFSRGGFFVDHHLQIHKDLSILVDNCRKYDKRILLFNRKGVIRDDVFWTSEPGDIFWRQCVDLEKNDTNVLDKVYKMYINDPRILVINEHQSNLFFT